MKKYNSNLTFTFPVTPEDDAAWREFPDTKSRLEACEMDSGTLEEISTFNLLQAVLSHPFLVDFYSFNNPDDGFAYLRKVFNGADEFFSREDTVPAAEEALAELSEEDAYDNLKRRFLLYYLKWFPRKSLSYSKAKTKSPMGNDIEVFIFDEEFTQSEKDSIAKRFKAARPQIEVISEATSTYNCHSYAWYNSSSQWNHYWMNYPTTYMSDGSYTKIPAINQCINRDIIYYGTPGEEHSGVLLSKPSGGFHVLSKWGKGPLILHDINDCPYSTANLSYYRCNYNKGYVTVINNWGVTLDELCIRHRRGNNKDLEDVTNCLSIKNNTESIQVLTFYYQNGFGAPFDYWWIKFKIAGGKEYKIKDNFFCNITKDDDGTATLTIDGDSEKLNVSFSQSSSDSTSIIAV